ncbi:MAG: putative 2-aminoethylphosphonate transport system permease protein PhnU, partial [Pseudomonadota bacterium]
MNAALRMQRALSLWALLGLLSFGLLPWYFLQQASLTQALPQVWAGPETASALVQALQHGRPWLWSGFAGLFICLVGLILPTTAHPKQQGILLLTGALLGLLGLAASGFAIGAVGWAFEFLEQWAGPLAQGQYGMGWGAAGVLLSLTILLGAGMARLGYFRGDVFIASAVVCCVVLLALFVVYPVSRSLMSGFYTEAGELSLTSLWDRVGTPRIWSLGCVGADKQCGVAWNTLGLALATAAGTTFLGTLIALWAERSGTRLGKPLNALALMPIITPPFV